MKNQPIKREKSVEKDYINLAITELDGNSMSRVIPVAIILALVVGLFTKFAVLNPLEKVQLAEQQNQAIQYQIEQLKSSETTLADLRESCRRYGTGWMNEGEAALSDRMETLDILEQWLMPAATIHSIRISGNTMSLNIENVTLEETAKLVQQLRELPNVKEVTVFTARETDRTAKTEIAMTVVLQKNAVRNITAEGGSNG